MRHTLIGPFVCLLVASLMGCTTSREVAPDDIRELPDKVKIVLVDGTDYMLTRTPRGKCAVAMHRDIKRLGRDRVLCESRMTETELSGITTEYSGVDSAARRITIPMAEVITIEQRELHVGRTVGTVVGGLVLVPVAAFAILCSRGRAFCGG